MEREQLLQRFGVGMLALLMIVSLISAGQHRDKIQVEGRLDQPGMDRAEMVAVCDVDPEGVRCWGLDGSPRTSVQEVIQAEFVSNRRQVGFRIGMKNRLVVFERPTESDNAWRWSHVPGQASNTVRDWRPGATLEWIQLAAPRDDRTASIAVRFNRRFPSLTIPIRKGSSFEMAGVRYTLETFGPLPKGDASNPAGFGMGWDRFANQAVFRLERVVAERSTHEPSLSLTVSVLGKDRRAITQATDNGTPVATSDGLVPGRLMAQVLERERSEQVAVFASNVDFRKAGFLVFVFEQSREVEFINVPLDPIGQD